MKKVLIANRGEIARRVIRTLRKMNIESVAIYSDADKNAPHVSEADHAIFVGDSPSSESYLKQDVILDHCLKLGVDGIHPGYGFLSENADFSRKVTAAGIKFIGPSPEAMEVMGDKLSAKQAVKEFNVPLVPGVDKAISDPKEAREIANKIGYPVLIKASAGGGGKGMRLVENSEELEEQMRLAQNEARSSFGNDACFVEKFVTKPRHIEIQVFSDGQGNHVYLFERECSIQRRHQKVIEEAPSPAINKTTRNRIGMIASNAAAEMGYLGLGTIEFLYENGEFFFIEMNTRLQVEHPITEAITGIDLVREQIRIAAGLPLSFKQDDVKINGHAIECRINAENPITFIPSPGKIEEFNSPSGLGVRVEACVYSGYVVPPYYDSLIAKLIVHGDNRNHCISRLKQALKEIIIEPISTTIELHKDILDTKVMEEGSYDIRWLENELLNSK